MSTYSPNLLKIHSRRFSVIRLINKQTNKQTAVPPPLMMEIVIYLEYEATIAALLIHKG